MGLDRAKLARKDEQHSVVFDLASGPQLRLGDLPGEIDELRTHTRRVLFPRD
jgi:hypothetical protein